MFRQILIDVILIFKTIEMLRKTKLNNKGTKTSETD